MILDLIHKYKGKITFDDLSIIDGRENLNQQIDSLKEDLFQADFGKEQLIDIGWYPSFNIKGSFQVRLIKGFDWDTPLFFGEAKNLCELKAVLENALLKLDK